MLTVISDGQPADDAVGANMMNAIAAGCGTAPATQTISQNTSGILDPSTSRPLLAADALGIMGGGNAYQRAMAYLMQSGDSPLVFSSTATDVTVTERATSNVVYQAPLSSLSNTHDIGGLMLIHEAVSGGAYLDSNGRVGQGTLAGGYYFTATIAPQLRTDMASWYVIEWTDRNGNSVPDAPDTYNVIASK
jgi:hypothetical protein